MEGWQPALAAVVMAATFALLVVPRPAAPDTLPLPSVDVRESGRAHDSSRALAKRARAEPLPYLVRAIGETLRAFGRAEAEGRTGDAARKLIELRGLTQSARAKHGDEGVQGLLGLQTELFVSAIARWEARQPDDGELVELGGTFLDKAKVAGWLAGERRLSADEHERRALFKLRWVEATGLRTAGGFAPTANELRVYYRFLLAHSGKSTEDALRQISAVEKVDLDYPGQFARGVVYFRGGQFPQAADAFQAHLTKHPTGPWALRAKNHLLAAAERTRETTPAP